MSEGIENLMKVILNISVYLRTILNKINFSETIQQPIPFFLDGELWNFEGYFCWIFFELFRSEREKSKTTDFY